jgi:hypothetical protein
MWIEIDVFMYFSLGENADEWIGPLLALDESKVFDCASNAVNCGHGRYLRDCASHRCGEYVGLYPPISTPPMLARRPLPRQTGILVGSARDFAVQT